MTSALSDACAWSVGKLKTSAEDWRTGMRLWRPERELAAGHTHRQPEPQPESTFLAAAVSQ